MVATGQGQALVTNINCPFCLIAERADENVREVFRDDKAVAFFPIEPAVLGHILVIPHRHVSSVWDLSKEEAEHIGLLISRMSRVIVETVNSEGLNIIQSNGKVATQSIAHVHFHLVPRWSDDGLGRIWPTKTNYSEQAKDETWDALRDACTGIHL